MITNEESEAQISAHTACNRAGRRRVAPLTALDDEVQHVVRLESTRVNAAGTKLMNQKVTHMTQTPLSSCRSKTANFVQIGVQADQLFGDGGRKRNRRQSNAPVR